MVRADPAAERVPALACAVPDIDAIAAHQIVGEEDRDVGLGQRLLVGGRAVETLAERVRMRPNTFLQNIVRARRFLAECLKRRGVDLGVELS